MDDDKVHGGYLADLPFATPYWPSYIEWHVDAVLEGPDSRPLCGRVLGYDDEDGTIHEWRWRPEMTEDGTICSDCLRLLAERAAEESEVNWAEASALVGEMEPW